MVWWVIGYLAIGWVLAMVCSIAGHGARTTWLAPTIGTACVYLFWPLLPLAIAALTAGQSRPWWKEADYGP